MRGSGPMSTTFQMTSPSTILMGASASPTTALLAATSSYAAGSTSVKIRSATSPAVDTQAILEQCDTGMSGNPCTGTPVDNGQLFACGDISPTCAQQTRGTAGLHQYERKLITSVTSDGDGTFTLGISPAIYAPNWSNSQSARLVWNQAQYNSFGVGIENLSISTPVGYGSNFAVQFSQCFACWIKGVRFVGSAALSPLWLNASKNGLVANNYFFPDPTIDANYPPAIQQTITADTLILNNIMHGSTTWEGNGGNAGNVLAYNYARDTFTMYYENSPFDHAAFSVFALFEGNQTGSILDDDTWGTHGLNTFFRNYMSCWEPMYQTQHPRGLAD